jgi:hypothetical protein
MKRMFPNGCYLATTNGGSADDNLPTIKATIGLSIPNIGTTVFYHKKCLEFT